VSGTHYLSVWPVNTSVASSHRWKPELAGAREALTEEQEEEEEEEEEEEDGSRNRYFLQPVQQLNTWLFPPSTTHTS